MYGATIANLTNLTPDNTTRPLRCMAYYQSLYDNITEVDILKQGDMCNTP